ASPGRAACAKQLHAIMAASFEKRRLLNWSECQALRITEADIATAGRDYRVVAQTSLGEFLASPDVDGFHSINSKRLTSSSWIRVTGPVAAVEYQIDGHY